MALSPGQILNNRYRIVKLLGQGGFGAVYRAWDMTFDLPCALKENTEISPEAQRQFEREARMLRALRHPNLPQVTDYFVIPSQGQYLVMDFVEGEDLQEKLDKAGGPLLEPQVLPWVEQVCDALTYLHSQNPPVIHRDIKPANIKITPLGQAILVDFGIAKVFDPNLKTMTGARAVTPGYSPNEQYGKGGRTDARTDVYALGATLYHLLTGQEPAETPERNLGVTLPAPRVLNSAVSPQVETAILKAMAMLPEQRFQSAVAFKQSLALTPLPNLGKEPGVRVPPTQVMRTSTLSITNAPAADTRLDPLHLARLVTILALVLFIMIVVVLTYSGQPATAIKTNSPFPLPSHTPITAPSDTPASPPPLAVLPSHITDGKGVSMALVPAGEFQMGSENGKLDERPVHSVYLDAFYIDLYLVTNRLYALCVQAGACTAPDGMKSSTRDSYYGNPVYDSYPVMRVSWGQAQTFCEWRGAHLPGEAQWEKAARGGLQGKTYPWGEAAPVCTLGAANGAQFANCSLSDTIAVGSFAPNGFGLFDMAGNAWEWVTDWYSATYYASSPAVNPAGPSSGQARVLRGGAWYYNVDDLRCANRNAYNPAHGYYRTGFRCARSP